MTLGQLEAAVRFGQAAFDTKQWAQAVGHWAPVLKIYPDNASLLHGLGIACFNLGQREEGLGYARRSTAAPGAQPEFTFTLMWMLNVCGQQSQIKGVLNQSIRAAGTDWARRFSYFKAVLEVGNAADVREYLFTYHHVVAKLPEEERRLGMARLYENFSVALNAYMTANRLEDVEHILDLGVRIFPENPKFSASYLELLFKLGDRKPSASLAKTLDVEGSKNPALLIVAARASAKLGDFRAATSYLYRAWSSDRKLAMKSRRHARAAELQEALNAQAASRRGPAEEILVVVIVAIASIAALSPSLGRSPAYWLTILAVALLFPLGEIVMRLALWRRNHVPGERLILPLMPSVVDQPMVDILGHAGVVYDAKSGFNYAPGAKFARGYFEKDRITSFNTITVDAHGNCGDSARDYESASVRTLAFGDSFTCSLASQTLLHWPHFFAGAAQKQLDRSVSAVNFGRGFYGVLQMVSLAAEAVPKWKPDLIIIAYITRDLARPRSWAHRAFIGGRERFLRTFEAGEPVAMARAFDATIVDQRVTQEWFAERAAKADRDALLDDILKRHLQCRARGDHRCLDLFDFSTSVLLNHFFYGDGLERESLQSDRERRMISDGAAFATDAALLADAAVLKSSGARIALVHIPARDEIVARKEFKASATDMELKRGLERALGVSTIELLPYILRETFDIKDFCINKEDDHPSALGERIYGEAIAAALIERGLLS